MDTTIQVSNELLERLRRMKVHSKESYENIIWDLVEDRLSFSAQTEMNLKKSEEDIKQGRTISLEELRKKIGA